MLRPLRDAVRTESESYLSDHPIVIGVRADPEPELSVVDLNDERAIPQPNTDRPIALDLLELEGRVSWIALEPFVVCIG
jgi:hypothetical protein